MLNASDLLTTQLLLQRTPHCEVNRIEVQTIRWPVFWFDKIRYVKVMWRALSAAITPFHTAALAQNIRPMGHNWIIIQQSCLPQKCYKATTWHIAVCHIRLNLFPVKSSQVFGLPCRMLWDASLFLDWGTLICNFCCNNSFSHRKFQEA